MSNKRGARAIRHAFCLALILVLAIGWLAFIQPVGATGENWYDYSWLYRKYHVINNSTGAGTNYSVKIVVCNGSSSDSGSVVYIDNLTRSDFGDVRFCGSAGDTLLSYWIEQTNTGVNATFWVKIAEDLSSANVTIFLYYGNPSATSISSGPNTFLKFDDFANATTYGDRWPVTQSDASFYAGSYRDITVNGTSGLNLGGRTGVYFTQEKRDSLGQSTYYVGGIDFIHYNLLASNCSVSVDVDYYVNRSYVPRNYWVVYASVVYNYSGTLNMTRFYDLYLPGWEFRYNAFSSGTAAGISVIQGATTIRTGDDVKTWYNKTEKSTVASNNGVVDVYVGVGGGYDNNYAYGSIEVFWDNLRIRKYVSPEPTHGEWGAQVSGIVYIVIWFTSGGTVTYNNTLVVNGSSFLWDNDTVIEFKALVEGNETYTFDNFTLDGSANISNPFDHLVLGNFSLWAYFAIPGGGAASRAGYAAYWAAGVLVILLIAIPTVVFFLRRK